MNTKIVMVLIAILLLFTVPSVYAAFPDTTNLKGYWDLNELAGNPVDKSGNGVVGVATDIIYGDTGKIGTDFNFYNGASYGVVDFNSSTYFMPDTFTWCFWANHSSIDANPYFFISREGSLATDISYQFSSYSTSDTFSMTNTAGTTYQVALGSNTRNEWHFYCGSFDGTKLYGWVDNSLKTPTTFVDSTNIPFPD